MTKAVSPHQKVRATDPATARLAAFRAFPRAGRQRHRILVAIAESENGLTYDEVSIITGIRGVSASTRISELHQGEWIEQNGDRVTSAGAKAVVWVVTDKARAALDGSEANRPATENAGGLRVTEPLGAAAASLPSSAGCVQMRLVA